MIAGTGDVGVERLEVAGRLELCMAVMDEKLIVITVVDAPVSRDVAEVRLDDVDTPMVLLIVGVDEVSEETRRLLGLVE